MVWCYDVATLSLGFHCCALAFYSARHHCTLCSLVLSILLRVLTTHPLHPGLQYSVDSSPSQVATRCYTVSVATTLSSLVLCPALLCSALLLLYCQVLTQLFAHTKSLEVAVDVSTKQFKVRAEAEAEAKSVTHTQTRTERERCGVVLVLGVEQGHRVVQCRAVPCRVHQSRK